MGEDMFVMRHIGRHKLAPRTSLVAIIAYNNIHVGIFLKTTISFHLYLIRFRTFKVRAYILKNLVCF
jgi:hypothetical protein